MEDKIIDSKIFLPTPVKFHIASVNNLPECHSRNFQIVIKVFAGCRVKFNRYSGYKKKNSKL